MSGNSESIYLERAVAPNLFTTTLHPEFVPALIAANLMTPRLWEWGRHIRDSKPAGTSAEILTAIHHFMDSHFYHATGRDFARWWGLQENREVADPDERSASEYAMRLFDRAWTDVPAALQLQHKWMEPLIDLSHDGMFPMYTYGTADLIHALARADHHHNLGVTSCLDECVLIAALALALGVCGWDDFSILGSPFHYTVFVRVDGELNWFNAKREFFSTADWRAHIEGLSQADREREFAGRLILPDRLIRATGAAAPGQPIFSGNLAAVSRAKSEIESFAGCTLGWLEIPEGSAESDSGAAEITDVVSPESVRAEALRKAQVSPVLAAALYIFRDPDFCRPEILRRAAARDYICRLLAAGAGPNFEDVIRSIVGTESIHGSARGRLAMPDEILACDTASEPERELLRETLRLHTMG